MQTVVGCPRDIDDVLYLPCDGVERGIVESLAQSTLEFFASQLDVSLPLSDLNGHVASRRRTSNPFAGSLHRVRMSLRRAFA